MKTLFIYLFFLILASLIRSGDFHGCRIMVDNCDEDCHDICKDTCSKNFGVCAEEERISYCYCFETKPKEEWIDEWSASFSPSSSSSSSSPSPPSHSHSSSDNHHSSNHHHSRSGKNDL
ncbi:uncharacterized protein LOC128398140 [Panonychus citri]|uniref:uncharacterized protein LOC128398140 n=1 Tax=Panonychus citri TaxID=50023 RepID=UPI0023080261|nr:uncharacterized protein LOC128398140 [Panonychus citri]